jgi:hypothetical protein
MFRSMIAPGPMSAVVFEPMISAVTPPAIPA